MPVILLLHDVAIAKARFDANWSYPTGCESWFRFIGHMTETYDQNQRTYVCTMGEDQARVIRALNGPHYKTILKMMAVQWREGVEHE